MDYTRMRLFRDLVDGAGGSGLGGADGGEVGVGHGLLGGQTLLVVVSASTQNSQSEHIASRILSITLEQVGYLTHKRKHTVQPQDKTTKTETPT